MTVSLLHTIISTVGENTSRAGISKCLDTPLFANLSYILYGIEKSLSWLAPGDCPAYLFKGFILHLYAPPKEMGTNQPRWAKSVVSH